MLNFLREFFTPKHRHTETLTIVFSVQTTSGLWSFSAVDGITCYLHKCPDCGEMLESGLAAEKRGERVGNFWAIRKSLAVAKEIMKTKVEYQISDFTGVKLVPRFDKDIMEIKFVEKQSKMPMARSVSLPKSIDIIV